MPSLKAERVPVVQASAMGARIVPSKDAQESPVSYTRGTETGEAITPPMLGGRKAARLKWIAEDPIGTAKGRMRGEFAVCKHFMVGLLSPGKWRWRMCLRVLSFLRLMIHT